MGFSAKILLDSINTVTHDRLTTFEVTYPRFIHSELLTHRMFSRNSASSRAIPIEKMLDRIEQEPVIPIHWGANQKGMQAYQEVDDETKKAAERKWLLARKFAVMQARQMHELGIHKQIVNRLVEPFMWITVIVSCTSFEHFRRLRVHKAAEPHFQKIAKMMLDVFERSEPTGRDPGQWHMPLTGFPGDADLPLEDLLKVSVARCARVSYLTHDGIRDVQADLDLFKRLRTSGHWSAFEHTACANNTSTWTGNFRGWVQVRKMFPAEFVSERYRVDAARTMTGHCVTQITGMDIVDEQACKTTEAMRAALARLDRP